MPDFKLDPATGDLDISNGLQLTTSYEEESRQRLNLAIGINLGEWFAAANTGLPWLLNNQEDFSKTIRYILGDKLPDNPTFIVTTLDSYIKDLSYIQNASSTYTFDRDTRKFTYTVSAQLLEGGTITLPTFETNL